MAEHVTDKECQLRHEPIYAFMSDWNNRWNAILLSLIGGLLLLVGNLLLTIYDRDNEVRIVPRVQAEATR